MGTPFSITQGEHHEVGCHHLRPPGRWSCWGSKGPDHPSDLCWLSLCWSRLCWCLWPCWSWLCWCRPSCHLCCCPSLCLCCCSSFCPSCGLCCCCPSHCCCSLHCWQPVPCSG